MTGSWQEWLALGVVAGALYYLWRRFAPRASPLVQPRGRLAKGIEKVKKKSERP